MELLVEPPPERPSLAGRIRAALATRNSGNAGVRAAFALAVLLAAGPVATLVGARLIGDRARSESIALAARTEPQRAAYAQRDAARTTLASLLARPGVAVTLDGLARVLPADAALVRAGRSAEGRLAIDVRAPDPDRLRAALRRQPLTAALRERGQRGTDGAMVVTLEGR